MNEDTSPRERAAYLGKKTRAYLVHVYTASGVAFAFLAAAEIASGGSAAGTAVPNDLPDPQWVFGWLLIAGLVDATDGPLARRWNVKVRAPRIGGDVIDDIVDYLTFTFLPLLLVWRMGWLPSPVGVWVCAAMVVSLLGFANVAAKQTEVGFFRGFPSYWNIVAFYVGLLAENYPSWGEMASLAVVLVLVVLTLAPVRFLYPNRAEPPWRAVVIWGAAGWTVLLLVLLFAFSYPRLPEWAATWLLPLSLVYPVFYFGLSFYLDMQTRSEA
jgi:phosphatidylcholine synthase